MPIRPIDIIMMPPTSQEASMQKTAQIHRSEIAQEQINQLYKKEEKHNSSQTIETKKAENTEYRYDAKEKGNNTFYDQQKKKKKKQDEKPKDEKPTHSTGFDMKI